MDRINVIKPWIGAEEAAAAAATIESGWIAQGPKVAEFEARFAESVQAGHAVALSNCTTALHLSLILAGVGPGDDVIVPSFSFIATTNAPVYVGARPVFADVEAAHGNLSVDTIQAALTPATKAVILVHQGGQPADVDSIRTWCERRGIVVVEDAACAAGSTYRGRPVGAGSTIAAWSFHPRKLVTTGEGGMLTTDNGDWAARARRLREHGMSMSAADRHASVLPLAEEYLEVGYNYRMTDVQAAIGLVQLRRLPELVARRRQIVARYQAAFGDFPGVRSVADPSWGEANFQSFWIELDDRFPLDRESLMEHLGTRGISARRGIMAAHRQPAYQAHMTDSLPVTDRLTDRTLILPVYHQMTDEEQSRVIEAIRIAAPAAA
jgi:dTDP-4-amino-4,6-dideoxygalactose transaminase